MRCGSCLGTSYDLNCNCFWGKYLWFIWQIYACSKTAIEGVQSVWDGLMLNSWYIRIQDMYAKLIVVIISIIIILIIIIISSLYFFKIVFFSSVCLLFYHYYYYYCYFYFLWCVSFLVFDMYLPEATCLINLVFLFIKLFACYLNYFRTIVNIDVK